MSTRPRRAALEAPQIVDWSFDEIRDRSISVFSKLSLCLDDNSPSQIPSNVIDAFVKGELDAAALESVRDLSTLLTRDDFIEASRCVEQWQRFATRDQSSSSSTSTPSSAPSPYTPAQVGADDAQTLVALLGQRGITFRPLLITLNALMCRLPAGSGAAASQHSDAGAMQIDEDAAEVAPSQAFDKPVVSADHDDDVEDDCVMFSSLALPAAELYISLLQMPASFILFNPTCWSATLYLLSMFAKTHMSASVGTKSKKKARRSSAGAARNRRSKGRRGADSEDEEDEVDIEPSQASDPSSGGVGGLEYWLQMFTTRAAAVILQRFCALLQSTSIARWPEALPALIECLAACARLPSDLCNVDVADQEGSSVHISEFIGELASHTTSAALIHSARESAFDALSLCCHSLQDDLVACSNVPLVMRAVLPALAGLSVAGSCGAINGLSRALPSRAAEKLRARTVEFVSRMMSELLIASSTASNTSSNRRRSSMGAMVSAAASSPAAALLGLGGDIEPALLAWLYVTIQHLLLRAADDAAASRSTVAASVAALVAGSPAELRPRLASLIVHLITVKMARAERVAARSMAVEAAHALLGYTELLTTALLTERLALTVLVLPAPLLSGSSAPIAQAPPKRGRKPRADANDEDDEDEFDFNESAAAAALAASEAAHQQEHDDDVPPPQPRELVVELDSADFGHVLLRMLLQRANDQAASVRAKALGVLADAINTASGVAPPAETVPVEGEVAVAALPADSNLDSLLRSSLNTMLGGPQASSSASSGMTKLMRLLHARAADSRPLVRRAAVQAMVGAVECIQSNNDRIFAVVLDVLNAACADVSTLIRKDALGLLSRLLVLRPRYVPLQHAWLHGCTAGVTDVESTVVERAQTMLFDNLLQPAAALVVAAARGSESLADIESAVSGKSHIASLSDDQVALGRACWSMLGAVASDVKLSRALLAAVRAIGLRSGGAAMLSEVVKAINIVLVVTAIAADAHTLKSSQSVDFATVLQRGTWLLAEECAKHATLHTRACACIVAFLNGRALQRPHVADGGAEINEYVLEAEVEARAVRVMGALTRTVVDESEQAAFAVNGGRVTKAQASLSRDTCVQLMMSMYDRCAQWRDSPASGLVAAAIRVLQAMTEALLSHLKAMGEAAAPLPWESHLLDNAHAQLQAFVYRGEGHVHGENPSVDGGIAERISRCLHIVGELCLVAGTAVTPDLLTMVHALIPPTLSSSNAAGTLMTVPLPASLRAHAFTALGKLCIAHEPIARKSVRMLIRELAEASDPRLRNNALLCLGDVARVHTQLVEPFVDALTARFVDEHSTVRQHAVATVASLLAEDYIKLKGPLFFRLARALADPCARVRALAEQCITEVVSTKAPTAVLQHFCELFFYLNDCTSHSTYNQWGAAGAAAERAFALPGDDDASFSAESAIVFDCNGPLTALRRRHAVYARLLKALPDEIKFQCSAKLARDLLGAVVEGAMSVEAGAAQCVIKDALLVLASPHIRLSILKKSAGADAEVEPAEPTGAADAKMDAARARLVGALVKKNFLENIVPVFVELKAILERRHSPLLRLLMSYLREFLIEYKKDLNEVLPDRQLARELEYDIERWEKQQQQQVTTVSTSFRTPMHGASSSSTTAVTPSGLRVDPNFVSPLAARGAQSASKARTTPFTSRLKSNAAELSKSIQRHHDTDEVRVVAPVSVKKSAIKASQAASVPPAVPAFIDMQNVHLGEAVSAALPPAGKRSQRPKAASKPVNEEDASIWNVQVASESAQSQNKEQTTAADGAEEPKKGRGRARKAAEAVAEKPEAAAEQAPSQVVDVLAEDEFKKPRGRPRKEAVAEKPVVEKVAPKRKR